MSVDRVQSWVVLSIAANPFDQDCKDFLQKLRMMETKEELREAFNGIELKPVCEHCGKARGTATLWKEYREHGLELLDKG